ncbi:MAG: prepilin-type N-terminal cleavage/methylation domain-containing protein [Gammaproteobacteria bacterium]|nr:prepilin-type N-terminal cleavage/methylation domain-containing protein [Gammaproteobacteria bacterium]
MENDDMHHPIGRTTRHSSGEALRRRRNGGFTLIELIIAMIVAAVLAAIAIPAYSSFVRQGRRTDAKTALLDMAGLEERYYSTTNTYSSAASALGYGSAAWPVTVGSGYYQIAQPTVTAAVAPTSTAPAGTPASFSITATAIGDQVNDTACQTFTVDSTGARTATSANCWN